MEQSKSGNFGDKKKSRFNSNSKPIDQANNNLSKSFDKYVNPEIESSIATDLFKELKGIEQLTFLNTDFFAITALILYIVAPEDKNHQLTAKDFQNQNVINILQKATEIHEKDVGVEKAPVLLKKKSIKKKSLPGSSIASPSLQSPESILLLNAVKQDILRYSRFIYNIRKESSKSIRSNK